MTTHLATTTDEQAPARVPVHQVRLTLPGAAALFYAGVQLDGGLIAAAYRSTSPVPADQVSFPFGGPLAITTSLTWGLAQVLFVLTLLAFARSGAVGSSRAGRTGAAGTVVGGVLFLAAHLLGLVFRDAHVDDRAGLAVVVMFLVATVVSVAGFVVAGVAVLRAGRWTGWRRYTVLAVGIWLLCMIPLQLTPALPLAVVVYAGTVAAFAVALLSERESR